MSENNWSKIKSLFSEACTLPQEQQRSFIEENCDSDLEMQGQILALLAAHNEATQNSEPDQIVSQVASTLLTGQEDIAAGDLIEQFQVEGRIGQGGMGDVYLGKRINSDFEQWVAIKIIRKQYLSPESLQRFRQERQILSSLNHRNIASFIGGGETDKGNPYIILEYVKGMPIDQYCEQQALSIRERIVLFKQVLSAVIYAHQNLVVHRDIKPSNVLVTDSGDVKLLDFGIAKLIQDEDFGAQADPQLTRNFERVLTPAYASPEQLLGEPVTTRSDVYALGTLLMHVLTSMPVFDLTDSNRREIENLVLETQPQKPSAKCQHSNQPDIQGRAKLLRGDLDNIVLKALQKSPERRYSSVEQFCQDIENYLSNYPILAKPDSRWYVFKKYLQRNRFSSAVLAVFLLSLITFAGVVTKQRVLIQQERDEAVRQAFIAGEATQFLERTFDASDPNLNNGEEVTARMLLDTAIENLQDLDPAPDVKVPLMIILARVLSQAGEYDKAGPLLNQAQELINEHPDPSAKQHAMNQLNVINQMATLKTYQGQYLESIDLHERLLPMLQTYRGVIAQADYDNLFIETQFGLGTSYSYNEQEELALRYFETAKDYAETLLANDSNELDLTLLDLPTRYFGYGHSLRGTGQYEASVEVLQRGIELHRELGMQPDLELAHGLNQLASTLLKLERLDPALIAAKRGLQIRQDIYSGPHIEIAASMGIVANIYSTLGQVEEALSIRLQMLDIVGETLGEEHPFYGVVLNVIGKLNVMLLRYDIAKDFFTRSHQQMQISYPNGHANQAHPLLGLGQIALIEKDDNAALKYLRQSVEIFDDKLQIDHPTKARALAFYGVALRRDQQISAGNAMFERGITMMKTLYDEQSQTYQGFRKDIDAVQDVVKPNV